jgi:GH43 family beta-xylosidase
VQERGFWRPDNGVLNHGYVPLLILVLLLTGCPGHQNATSTYLARMSSSARIEGPEVLLTEPDQLWEIIGYKANEGPAVLVKNDPNRHTRARILQWTPDGWPDFGQMIGD